jgi:hypothetical protein
MNNILKIIIYPIWFILYITIIIPLIVRFATGLSWDDVRDEYEDFLDD